MAGLAGQGPEVKWTTSSSVSCPKKTNITLHEYCCRVQSVRVRESLRSARIIHDRWGHHWGVAGLPPLCFYKGTSSDCASSLRAACWDFRRVPLPNWISCLVHSEVSKSWSVACPKVMDAYWVLRFWCSGWRSTQPMFLLRTRKPIPSGTLLWIQVVLFFFPVARSRLVTLSIGLSVETPYCSMFQPPISPKEFAVATLARVTSRTNVRCLPPPQPPLHGQLPLTRRWPPPARPKPLRPPRQSLLRRRGQSLSQCLAVRPWWIYCDRLSPFFVVINIYLDEDATMCSSRL